MNVWSAIVASLHYLAIMGIAATLTLEVITLKGSVTRAAVARLARVDMLYGISAGLVLATGLARVFWFGKGPDFYLHNVLFHIKLTIFLAVALWSILPTVRFIRWNAAAKASGVLPTEAQFNSMRKVVFSELHLLALLPILAAFMARGFGFSGG
jgi:putative membrane protein